MRLFSFKWIARLVAVLASILAVGVFAFNLWNLYPIMPPGLSPTDLYEQAPENHSGEGRCSPERLAALKPVAVRNRQQDRCNELANLAEREAYSLKQARRSADADQLQMYLSFSQARLGAIGGFLSLLAVCLTGYTAYEAAKASKAAAASIEHARDDLQLAHPPEILVRHAMIAEKLTDIYKPDRANIPSAPNFVPGLGLEGVVWGVRGGNGTAIVEKSNFAAFWCGEHLPMYSAIALEDDVAKMHKIGHSTDALVFEDIWTIEKGKTVGWRFGTTVPANYDPSKMFLYLAGFVVFHDDRLKIRHAVYFARKYDTRLHRFIKVENPDWEGSE